MRLDCYQDMQLLRAVEHNFSLTQRDLGKQIGVALGLTNLRLHRLSTKGFIRIVEGEKHRAQYFITPEGIREKDRLISEYLTTALRSYSGLRQFFRDQLAQLRSEGKSDFLLIGTGEIAEVAYLTIQEEGAHLVAVVGDPALKPLFFHLPVSPFEEISAFSFDRVIVASLEPHDRQTARLLEMGIPPEKIIRVPDDRTLVSSSEGPEALIFGTPAVVSKRRGKGSQKRLTPADTDVMVLCGGRGTRLGGLTDSVPKPLLPVGGEPFLLRLLQRLKQEGFCRFVLAGHYLSKRFEAFLEHYSSQLPNTRLVVEPELLGTGGALRFAADHVSSSPFLVLNGDSWVEQPMGPVLEDHGRYERDFTVVAVEASRVEGEALRKGVWRLGPEREAADFVTQEQVVEGWVNAGCYVMNRAMVSLWPRGSYSLEANLPILLSGRRTAVFCSQGRLLDIGTMENYGRAAQLLDSFAVLES